jgi:hypothetical protein
MKKRTIPATFVFLDFRPDKNKWAAKQLRHAKTEAVIYSISPDGLRKTRVMCTTIEGYPVLQCYHSRLKDDEIRDQMREEGRPVKVVTW